MNQQDQLESLESQILARPQEERDKVFKRLASYMLNLSPIGHEQALAHAAGEAGDLLSAHPKDDGVVRLLVAIESLRIERAEELSVVTTEIDGLLAVVREFLSTSDEPSEAVRSALTALAYLRNPYDRIFDLQVEGGLSDDVDVIRNTWAELVRRVRPSVGVA